MLWALFCTAAWLSLRPRRGRQAVAAQVEREQLNSTPSSLSGRCCRCRSSSLLQVTLPVQSLPRLIWKGLPRGPWHGWKSQGSSFSQRPPVSPETPAGLEPECRRLVLAGEPCCLLLFTLPASSFHPRMRKCQNLQWMPSKAYLQKQAKGGGSCWEGMGEDTPGSEAVWRHQPSAECLCHCGGSTASHTPWPGV